MEDAIRAIEEEWDGCCSEYPATQIIYDTTEAIERLPIIQPEITHEQAVAYLQSTGWMQEHDRQMMLDGVHRLTAQLEPHWIPVTERLPDNSRNVLITSKGGVSMAWYNGSYFEKGASTHHRKMKTVTAWRELPESYKGG